jgi:hypothetical protein
VAQIEYCDNPSDLDWNPMWDAKNLCEEQSDIEMWFEGDMLWFPSSSNIITFARQEEPNPNQEKFERLARQWREETKTMSSTTDRVLNSAYQDIIGMGEVALIYIFRELANNGGHWFWALRHITHDNPVPPQDAGKIKKMTEAWLRWGQEHHYL